MSYLFSAKSRIPDPLEKRFVFSNVTLEQMRTYSGYFKIIISQFQHMEFGFFHYHIMKHYNHHMNYLFYNAIAGCCGMFSMWNKTVATRKKAYAPY
jgi:hypothetical protein